ncbi:MAG: tetratricopeptide repeat protein [Bacteroidales bacterium]
MKYLIVFILCFFILLIKVEKKAFCQNSEIDSIRVLLAQTPNDTNKVLRFTDFSYRCIKYQIDTSLIYGWKALELSQKLNYKFGRASALNQLGLVHKYLANFDSSLYYYNESYHLFDSLENDFEKAKVLNRIGNVYKRYGEFNKSIDCFLNCLRIYQNINDSTHMSDVLNNLGVLYYDMGYYDKSLEYYFSNLEIRKKINHVKDIHIVYMNIGNIYNQKEDFTSATKYYKQALQHIIKPNDKYDYLLLLHNIGRSYEETGNFLEAKNYYQKAILLEKEICENEMLVLSLQGLGNTFIKNGDKSIGIKYLEESYNLANRISDIRKQHLLSKNLYLVYEKEGNYRRAFSYLKEFVVLEDSIYSLERKKQILELEQKYESEKQLQQISFLEKQKEIQNLQLAKAKQDSERKMLQRNILILTVLFITAFLLYMAFENRRRKRLNSVLKRQNNHILNQRVQIVKQNEELLEANNTKDRLFQIIAHDLRSPLVSVDSLVQLIPFWIEDQDYNSILKLSKSLEVSISNLLSLIDNLLNWALNQQGKFPYKPETINLADISNEIMEMYKPIAELKKIQILCDISENAYVDADRNMVSAILRNLINNAIKFTSENGSITVGSNIENAVAHVWVKDDGIGFSEDSQKRIFEIANRSSKGTKGEMGKGLGLFFCKEFVTINKGDIFIDSELGKGTTITFTLPARNFHAN